MTSTAKKRETIPNAKRSNLFVLDPEPDNLKIIGVDTPHKQGEHPLWDKRAFYPVDEETVANIIEYGVIKPIVIAKEKDVGVIVVAGRTTVLATRVANQQLRKAGKPPIEIPCVYRKEDAIKLAGIMVSENEIRKDDGILVKAEKATNLKTLGYSTKKISITFGVTEQAVNDWLAFLKLDPILVDKVEAGEMSPSAAIKFASLEPAQQVSIVEKIEEERGEITTKVAMAEVRTAKKEEKARRGPRQPRGPRANKVAAAQESNTPDKETPKTKTIIPPKKRTVNKLIEFIDNEGLEVDESFVQGVKWAFGLVDTSEIDGLAELLADATK